MGFDTQMRVLIVIGIIAAIAFAIIIPLAVIWALNLLFHLNIEVTFWTWLAVFILLLILFSSVTIKRSCD